MRLAFVAIGISIMLVASLMVFASGVIPSNGTIHACYFNSPGGDGDDDGDSGSGSGGNRDGDGRQGSLRVVNDVSECRSDETPISWEQGADGSADLALRVAELEARFLNFDADGDGFTPATGDCGDADPVIFPGAPEVNDGKDNNCDGQVDNDRDRDGLFDDEESAAGTDPNNPDTDGDGLTDFEEVNGYVIRVRQNNAFFDVHVFPNPLIVDTDGDGLTDFEEAAGNTNAELVDTDGDGFSDPDEINIHGTSPSSDDTDSDLLSDFEEINVYGSNPRVRDTDFDGLIDGQEVITYGTNPLIVDSDGDGINDGEEVLVVGTDPANPDTDGDGFSDGDEVNVHFTDPLDPDSHP